VRTCSTCYVLRAHVLNVLRADVRLVTCDVLRATCATCYVLRANEIVSRVQCKEVTCGVCHF